MIGCKGQKRERNGRRGIPAGLKSASASCMPSGLSDPVCHHQCPRLGQSPPHCMALAAPQCKARQKPRCSWRTAQKTGPRGTVPQPLAQHCPVWGAQGQAVLGSISSGDLSSEQWARRLFGGHATSLLSGPRGHHSQLLTGPWVATELRMAKLWQELTAQHVPIRWIILMQGWPPPSWCCLGALGFSSD